MPNFVRGPAGRRLVACAWVLPLVAGCSHADSSAVARDASGQAPSVTSLPAASTSGSPAATPSRAGGAGTTVASPASSRATARAGSSSPTSASRRSVAAGAPHPSDGSVAGSASGAGASTSDPEGGDGPTYLIECPGADPAERPASVTLSCGDGNESLIDVTWSSWGGASASATATYVVNTCEPSCAEGSPAEYPVHVVAGQPVRRSAGELYSALRVTFDAARPDGAPASEDYAVGT